MVDQTSASGAGSLQSPDPAGRAPRGAATRSSIVTTAMRMFAERGYAATSIDAIAGAVGLTKGALYWHFRNKQDLFEAILDEIRTDWRRHVLARLGDAADPLAQIERLFDNYVTLRAARPELCQFMQRAAMDPEARCRERARDVYGQTAAVIAAVLDEAVRRSPGTLDTDTTAAAHAILGALSGCDLQCRANEALSFADLVGEIKGSTLRGLRSP